MSDLKTYDVRIMYHGCISQRLQAVDKNDALDRLRACINSYDDRELWMVAEVAEEDTDVEEVINP